MMLPDELEWVLEMLGFHWPTANEDKLRDSADVWRKFGDDVRGLHTKANTSARQVVAHNAGESIDKFSKTYEKFDAGNGSDGYLANAAEAAYLIANVLESCAYLVEFAKWAVIAQLIALAIEIAAAHAAAPFTFGLSEVAGLGATQVTRLIVRRLLDELKQALIEAIVETMKEPVISAVEAIISDLIRQTVNVGFGAQEGYDVGATIKAGGTAGLDALRQSPQTFAEGVRDSLGQKAGSRARDAIDSRIDGYDGPSGLSGGDIGGDSGLGKSDSGGSNSTSSESSSSGSGTGSGPGSGSDSSTSTRTSNGNVPGANIGNGISADTGGTDVGAPNIGAGPSSDYGSGSDSGSPSSSDTPYARPTQSPSGSSLSDFDDPSPGGPSSSSSSSDSSGPSSTPSTSGPSHTSGGSPVSGLSSPTAQSAPTPASSGGTSSSPGGGSIGTQIDGLAASAPTQSNAAPTPTTADSSPAGTGGRSDGGSAMPTSPTAPSTGGTTPGTHAAPGGSGGTPSATSPTPNSGPPRNPSTGTPTTPSATGTGPASTPSPTSPTTPRSTPTPTPAPTPTPDGRIPGTADGRTSSTPDGRTSSTPDGRTSRPDGRTSSTPDGRIPTQRTPGSTTPGDGTTPRNSPGTTTPGDRSTPGNTPGTTPGDRTPPRNTTDPSTGTRTTTPGQNPAQSTPPMTAAPSTGTPTSTPSPSTGTGPGRTPNPSPQPGPTNNPTSQGTPSTPGTAGTPNQPSTGSTPTRPPHQPPGSTPNTPNTPSAPNTPNQPTAQPNPQQPPANTPNQQQQPQVTVTPVPIHHVTPTPHNPPHQSTPRTPDSSTPNNSHQQNSSDNPKPKDPPTPASETRNTNPPGGVIDPTRDEQDALENSVPRDENGDPTRPPNPADGRWVERINGEGRDVPGRNNNCVDVALSTVDTYAGNPTAAASRTPDLDADGNPSDRGEKGGRDRIEHTLGARFSDLGNGRDAFNRLENTLRDSGHGSQAVIITQDANGRAHAWNAVNHNGKITYIDAQTGQQSSKPLHSGDNGVFAIPLDSNRQPVTPDQHAGDGTQPQRKASETPTGADRRAPDEPAGTDPDETKGSPDDEGGKPNTGTAPERLGSTPFEEDQKSDHQHYGVAGDQAQRDFRDHRDIRQIDLDPVYDTLRDFANNDNGGLRDLLEGSKNGTTWRRDDLADRIPGFNDLSRGQQAAAVGVLARLSNDFHMNQGVGASPYRREGDQSAYRWSESEDATEAREAHRKRDINRQTNFPGNDNEKYRESRAAVAAANGKPFSEVVGSDAPSANPAQRTRHYLDETYGKSVASQVVDATADMKPNFLGRNFAVMEVYDPDTKQTHYVADSSFNYVGPRPDHSEPHLGGWIERLNEDRAAKGQNPLVPAHLYTEREPCGHPSESKGHADCGGYIRAYLPEEMGTTYATAYRKGEQVEPFVPSEGRPTAARAMEVDFQDHLNKVADILKAYALPTPNSPA
ncbi:toxin glutamine deamidase domain-containing protein [Streptomyces sp. UG1]|uniref:toxin glutamine deamidase domain-containing protein n=1 Tax=Streptomyces sp. UG1 TaxID=3417652 RepID=UPI003CE93AFF